MISNIEVIIEQFWVVINISIMAHSLESLLWCTDIIWVC